MIPESVKQAVKLATAGMSESAALAEVGRIFNPRIVAARIDPVGAVPEGAGAWPAVPILALKDRGETAGGVRFTSEETEQIRAAGGDPDKVAAFVDKDRLEKERTRKAGGPLVLTEKDRVALKSMGVDPDELVFTSAAKDAADHARLKAEYRKTRGA